MLERHDGCLFKAPYFLPTPAPLLPRQGSLGFLPLGLCVLGTSSSSYLGFNPTKVTSTCKFA